MFYTGKSILLSVGMLLCIVFSNSYAQTGVLVRQQKYTDWVTVGSDGKLCYRTDSLGNKMPDFSWVGYHFGEKDLPKVPVLKELYPSVNDTDDTRRIQDALNELGQMPLDEKGIRGALLLKKGIYHVEGQLLMQHSGVILRGEGMDDGGTIIVATGYGHKKYKRTLIEIGLKGASFQIDESSKMPVADNYVPIGTREFHIKDATLFSVGDRIIIHRPSTAEWISSIGCDSIPPNWYVMKSQRWVEKGSNEKSGFYYRRSGLSFESGFIRKEGESWSDFKKRVPISPDGKKINGTHQWQPGEYDQFMERRILAINGNMITIDAPIPHSISSSYGGGFIYHYSTPGRVYEVGVENLKIISQFGASTDNNPYGSIEEETKSEDHGWEGIVINPNTENIWVRNVAGLYFGWSLVSVRGRNATISHCVNLGHASRVEGGRRYPFMIDGQLNLVRNCSSLNKGRHEFVTQAKTYGPNVFLDCTGQQSAGVSGPHHRYSVCTLFDNASSTYGMESRNRGNSGTGHGWAGVQSVFWNCTAPKFDVEAAPGTISWIIGSGSKEEAGNNRVEPRSLYLMQLNERLGNDSNY